MSGDSIGRQVAMRRIGILAGDDLGQAQAVAAGLAERWEVMILSRSRAGWFLGNHALGETPAASAGAAVTLAATADVLLPVGVDRAAYALANLVARPCPAVPGPIGADWWSTRLAAVDAGLRVADGICVRSGAARALDFMGPVTVRPATRAPRSARTDVAEPGDLQTALHHALVYADRVVVEEASPGPAVTMALVCRADGGVLVSSPIGEPARELATAMTGEMPLRARALSTSGGRTGTRPPLPPPGSDRYRSVATDRATRSLLDQAALATRDAVRGGGAMTVDFVLDPTGGMPILTAVDIAPNLGAQAAWAHAFAASGVAYPDLLDILVGGAA